MKTFPPKQCKHCGNIVKRQNIFCDSSCSASYNNSRRQQRSVESRLKTSNSLKGAIRTRVYKPRTLRENKCNQCGNNFIVDCDRYHVKYCSKECLLLVRQTIGRNQGRKTAALQVKRSKNEILFGEYCSTRFNQISFNEPVFNGWDADIIIHDVKIAVLWNGPWHYKKILIKHSVEQVQNRDKIKIKEISASGYTPYIIKDMGSYNPKFVEIEFKNFITWFGELAIT